jgi:hypothetical protein
MSTEQHRSERELSIIQSEEVCNFEFILLFVTSEDLLTQLKINTCYEKAKKKSQKAWKFPANCLYICKTFV